MVGAAAIRAVARRTRVLALTAALGALASPAMACTTPRALATVDCAAAARLRTALDGAALAARIDAWGRSVPEVWYDLARLESAEQARLVLILEDVARGSAPWSTDQRAMYLVLVSLMRESRLFAGIVRAVGIR